MNMKNPKDSQNFITSKNHVKNILKNTNITGQDKIIEIGAGKGHFTRELDLISQSVLAIEIDEKLARISQQKIETSNNSKVLTMDFLQFDFPKNTDYKIFGSIPYNISTDIVWKIAFESNAKYSYLIVEKGFAKRLKNLQRALGLLLAVELDIKIIKNIPRSYFHPKPKVDSVLIVLKRHHPLIAKKDYPLYKKFVYKWVNKEYKSLFTNNQFRRAKQYAKLTNLTDYSIEQFISIFNSYKLFQ